MGWREYVEGTNVKYEPTQEYLENVKLLDADETVTDRAAAKQSIFNTAARRTQNETELHELMGVYGYREDGDGNLTLDPRKMDDEYTRDAAEFAAGEGRSPLPSGFMSHDEYADFTAWQAQNRRANNTSGDAA